jgi:hypothetical protein
MARRWSVSGYSCKLESGGPPDAGLSFPLVLPHRLAKSIGAETIPPPTSPWIGEIVARQLHCAVPGGVSLQHCELRSNFA